MSWNDCTVHTYERTIPLKIPGYFTLYDMMNHFLLTTFPKENMNPNLLVIGAGGGQEILSISKQNSNLSFTGVDPSESMLQLAKKRIKNEGIQNHVHLVHGTIHTLLPNQLFDAATCMLVLHFVPTIKEKKELINEISSYLKPGAPFFLSSINGIPHTSMFSAQLHAWRNHMIQNQIPLKDWDRFENSFETEIFPISENNLLTIMEECGFTQITRFFTSFLIDGYVACKR
ncbi:TPA: class I SAM-dependent methyltransferase [Bacillus cereus]|uniref:Class I SAM-dependent methyltransferase n=1 Tax=Bacillus cereus TaxID=1396 RepID=A0A1D3NM42_BACCE|nr:MULTISPECIES: class I SAM-dependent methyltransferase [Bacillus]MCP1175980.1 class I SAM-dependent methyltransferase [Bacillus sp. 1663tsa1]MCP1280040.1 class I SAM-dependent methyltransferase [Bacillus sp. S0635]MCQ6344460.1 class I SAM-dependent methyltransferase [Bacillus cereus]MCU5462292.1 class I SAM-dependent methyltransferase [Bacillus cereus]MCU5751509.1 class I SAM-dependent methyltransferase [Bacillus cereus]